MRFRLEEALGVSSYRDTSSVVSFGRGCVVSFFLAGLLLVARQILLVSTRYEGTCILGRCSFAVVRSPC